MPYTNNISFNEGLITSASLTNTTFVSPSGFRLLIDNQKYKNAQFTVQTVALPDMSITGAPFNTPQRNITAAPDKVDYGIFDMTFLIDEDLYNYKEIHDWMLGMVTEADDSKSARKTRDMSLMILNSHNNVSREIKFIDAYPVNLSSLPFDATTTDVEYLIGNVSFNYSYFKLA
jgi:hypothetical protein